jgi:hypothetical protein
MRLDIEQSTAAYDRSTPSRKDGYGATTVATHVVTMSSSEYQIYDEYQPLATDEETSVPTEQERGPRPTTWPPKFEALANPALVQELAKELSRKSGRSLLMLCYADCDATRFDVRCAGFGGLGQLRSELELSADRCLFCLVRIPTGLLFVLWLPQNAPSAETAAACAHADELSTSLFEGAAQCVVARSPSELDELALCTLVGRKRPTVKSGRSHRPAWLECSALLSVMFNTPPVTSTFVTPATSPFITPIGTPSGSPSSSPRPPPAWPATLPALIGAPPPAPRQCTERPQPQLSSPSRVPRIEVEHIPRRFDGDPETPRLPERVLVMEIRLRIPGIMGTDKSRVPLEPPLSCTRAYCVASVLY